MGQELALIGGWIWGKSASKLDAPVLASSKFQRIESSVLKLGCHMECLVGTRPSTKLRSRETHNQGGLQKIDSQPTHASMYLRAFA